MKKYLCIPFLFPLLSIGQSSLELKIFNELNEYRKSYGLRTLPYDSLASVASSHHSNWMNLSGVVSHFENSDMKKFQELYGLENRNEYFEVQMFNEICTAVPSQGFSSALTDDFISESVIESFASSPKHNDTMKLFIEEDFPIGLGIGAIKGKDTVWVTINFSIIQRFD